MRFARWVALPALTILALGCAGAPALALAGVTGGTQAPSSPKAGGIEFGVPARAVQVPHPVISTLSVPAGATAGAPPKVTLRLDEKGVGTVYLQVTITNLATRRAVVVASMGWSHTGRTLMVRWPASARLPAGSYEVSVSAHDHHGAGVLRQAHSAGQAALTVTAVAKPPVTTPPALAPAPAPAVAVEAGVPTPAQTAAAGAVFPVAGAHNFGGPEDRFGAPRGEHIHQGQDVLTEEGTPIVVPMAGTISWTSYQAGGAGYYAVEHTSVGFDFMFAHCEAGSLAVSSEQAVAAGQQLCLAGQTGDATAPHLHFEMWVGGWQASTGHPIDPLPFLEAWDRLGAEAH